MAVFSIVLQLVGLVMDFAGILLMANSYTSAVAGRGGIWSLLASALVRGGLAESAAEWQLSSENRLAVLQGLALIGAGFLVQVGGGAASLIVRLLC